MWYYYFNVGLTYFTIGFGSAVFFYFILKKPVLGKFWGALLVGLIGSFLGGVLEYFLDDVFRYLSDFNSVNVFAAFGSSLMFIWVLTKVSDHK